MIKFSAIRQYTHLVDGIMFPFTPDRPYVVFYFSENSNFLDDYPKLSLRKMDFRTVIVPYTKVPRVMLTAPLKNAYRRYTLISLASNQPYPQGRNLIVDMTQYLQKLDEVFKPGNYRTRAGNMLLSMVSSMMNMFPSSYQKVFMYSVDLTKDVPPIVNRKSFPMIREIKDENLHFDNLVLATIRSDGTRFRLIVKDGEYKFPRLWFYLRNVKGEPTEEELEDESTEAATKVLDAAKDVIPEEEPEEQEVETKEPVQQKKEKIRKAVVKYLKNNPEELDKIEAGEVTKQDHEKIVAKAIIANVSGDESKAKSIVSKIPEKKTNTAVKAISKTMAKEMIKQEDVRPLSTDPGIQTYKPYDMVDKKAPTNLFQKRQIDFDTNLKQDVINSFKVLETKDVPVKFESIQIVDKTSRLGEIERSDISILKIQLVDKFGNKHNVEIEIPKIDPKTGTFMLNGIRQCLINQIILCPITFPVPGESKFESSYSKFRIYTKTARKLKFLEAFMQCKMPLMFLLSLLFGFEETIRYYGLTYSLTETRPSKDDYYTRVNENTYVVFGNVKTVLQKQLCAGFIYGNPSQYDLKVPFPSKEYFEALIIKVSGRVNTVYNINNNKENIVDPVVKQVLRNMQLPTELNTIMRYMAQKVIEGYKIDRNDLTNQRVRNSEVLVHLIQKQILSSYTVYREQVLAGNKNASLTINPTKALSEFRMTELAVTMEYANPIEEMSTMTRISPVGKAVSGIPDKRAIYAESRNTHPSYYGNVDPLDTPEGGNIGIVQQLTIDAALASSRGLIKQKAINNNEKAGMLSTTSVLTPFIENNDGARVIMITNQAKQMLPLKNPQPPPVMTGYESILTNFISDNFVKKASCNGPIVQVTTDFIVINCNGKKTPIDITPIHLRSGSGINTLSVFKPVVKVGDVVKRGDVIAEGACIADGSIATGRPLLVAVMPYLGYTFEDGLMISDKLVNKDLLTSLHGIEEVVILEENDKLVHIAELGQMTEKGEPLIRKIHGSIDQLLGTNEDESEEIFAGQYIKKSPGGRIVDIEVFSNLPEDKFPKLKPLIDRTNKKFGKPTKEKFKYGGETVSGILIRFRIEQELRIGEGDKLCNRHGNKGIITKVGAENMMPRLPNGEHVDLIMNPIGIIGRMNPGQLYEMYCGLICKEMAVRILNSKTKEEAIEIIYKVYSKLDTSKNNKFTTTLMGGLRNLSPVNFKKMLENIKKNGFYPLIIPPFSAPNNDRIKEALNVLNLKTGYKLFLPELNAYTASEVPVGYMYIAKLEHIGANKIYARSTGPVTGKTAQPTSGKRREGGQRVGELDTYSFISYNCPAVLAELMGPLSDDYTTKEEIIADIVQNGHAEYRPAKITPAKDLLNAYFISLMLNRS